MHSCASDSPFVIQPAAGEIPLLSGALANLARLLFSEAWRAKSQPAARLMPLFESPTLSRDSMRRNVATKSNIPHTQVTE